MKKIEPISIKQLQTIKLQKENEIIANVNEFLKPFSADLLSGKAALFKLSGMRVSEQAIKLIVDTFEATKEWSVEYNAKDEALIFKIKE